MLICYLCADHKHLSFTMSQTLQTCKNLKQFACVNGSCAINNFWNKLITLLI